MSFRTIIAGARSVRQGTGPFLAAAMNAAGARVTGIVGTSNESTQAAQVELKNDWGLTVNTYTSITAAVEAEQADVVVVSTPWQFHSAHLEEVARAGCHCLVEKPLLWPGQESDVLEVIKKFEERGLLLHMVSQWPFTLREFRELHGTLPSSPSTFCMRLSPLSIGPHMIPDAAPHFVSLLQALVGAGGCRDVRLVERGPDDIDLRCMYAHAGGELDATLTLKTVPSRPRPAWIEIDGLRAERAVELPQYRQFFVAGDKRVALDDPMHCVAREFLSRLEQGTETNAAALLSGHRNLMQLAAAMPG